MHHGQLTGRPPLRSVPQRAARGAKALGRAPRSDLLWWRTDPPSPPAPPTRPLPVGRVCLSLAFPTSFLAPPLHTPPPPHTPVSLAPPRGVPGLRRGATFLSATGPPAASGQPRRGRGRAPPWLPLPPSPRVLCHPPWPHWRRRWWRHHRHRRRGGRQGERASGLASRRCGGDPRRRGGSCGQRRRRTMDVGPSGGMSRHCPRLGRCAAGGRRRQRR